MTDDKAPELEIQIQPMPTPESMMAPPGMVNTVRVTGDAAGFTLYFFSVPADMLEHPGLQERIKQEMSSNPPPPGTKRRRSELRC